MKKKPIIFNSSINKKSLDILESNVNLSIRKAYSAISDLTAKMQLLYDIGECSKSEINTVVKLLEKQEQIVDKFKESFNR